MKKNKIIAVVVLVTLGIYAIYLGTRDTKISSYKPHSEFAIKQTDKLDKMVIVDIDETVATLTKKDGEWYINNKFKAKPENIETILTTVKNIEVQSVVAKKSIPSVIQDIASTNKKVDFYSNGKLLKTYFIGNPTQDHAGTFMLLSTPDKGKSSIPYIMHIPGFNGFLSTRFYSDETNWRFTGVFNYEDLEEISSVKVTYPKNPENSFTVNQLAGNLMLNDGKQSFDEALLRSYLVNYKKIHFNRFIDMTDKQIDSVASLTPDYSISVKSKTGNINKVDLYKMAARIGDIDPITNKQRVYDPNYCIGFVNDSKDIARYQYYVVDPLLKKKSYFTN